MEIWFYWQCSQYTLYKKTVIGASISDSDCHSDQFSATYLVHHFLSEVGIVWLGQFQHLGLGDDEQRALI